MKAGIERRYQPTEFRLIQADSQPTKIAGYAAVFNRNSENLGFIEQLDPHCFDNVLATNPDVRGLWNHDSNCILGRTKSGTLTLRTDSTGLYYEIDIPDTTLGRDLTTSMQRGDVDASSFGFIVKRDQWQENGTGPDTRRILEIGMLLDVSPVTYPAYPDAATSLRALPASIPAEIRSKIESQVDDNTDDDVATDDDSTNDDSTDQNDTCDCDCAQCLADACNLCSNDDCDDEFCSCYNQRSMRELYERKLMLIQRTSKQKHK